MPRPKSDAEIKSARISLLLPPTLYADVVTMTQIKKCSINDFFCTLAEQAVKKNRGVIDNVNAVLDNAFAKVDFRLCADDVSCSERVKASDAVNLTADD